MLGQPNFQPEIRNVFFNQKSKLKIENSKSKLEIKTRIKTRNQNLKSKHEIEPWNRNSKWIFAKKYIFNKYYIFIILCFVVANLGRDFDRDYTTNMDKNKGRFLFFTISWQYFYEIQQLRQTKLLSVYPNKLCGTT